MGGLGYILGGAMQGIGSGLVAQAGARAESEKSAAAERREIALQRLRGEQAIEQQNNGGTITAAAAEKADEYQRGQTTHQGNVTNWVERNKDMRGAKIKETEDIRDYDQEVRLKRLEASLANEAASRDAGIAKNAAKFKRELELGDIRDTFEGADGTIWALYKNGEKKSTGIRFAPKTSTSTSETVLGQARDKKSSATKPAANRPPLSSFGS